MVNGELLLVPEACACLKAESMDGRAKADVVVWDRVLTVEDGPWTSMLSWVLE